MMWIGKVIIFLVNMVWYVNLILNGPLKTLVALIVVYTTGAAIWFNGSGFVAFGWFLLLTFITAWPSWYQPKGMKKL
jgi:type IV secretory pathway VirB2 component (pilin)|tara:strand:- start:487 stop:717 length:231 start_codon:yes stop_codon:yes gene_type:complete